MDQTAPTAPNVPAEWAESIARAEADLAAGRIHSLDLESLCQQIESEADELERQNTARHTSPA